MSLLLFANDALTTLANPVSSVDTTITLAGGGGAKFPVISGDEYFVATLQDAATGIFQEVVHVTALTGDVATVVRAQEGTAAQNWVAGDLFANLWTAGQASVMMQQAQSQAQSTNYGVDAGTANAYVVTLTPALTSNIPGMPIRVKIANTSTGASTLNAGASVQAIKHPNGTDIGAGDLVAGGIYEFEWDGSNYQVVSQVWPVSNAGLASNSVTSDKIANAAVDNSKLANAAVDNSKLANAAVDNSKLANVSTATFKGRTSAGTGSPEDLTATQATALLDVFVGDSGSGGTKGLVPAPAAGDASALKFLLASGVFSQVISLTANANGYSFRIGPYLLQFGQKNTVGADSSATVTFPVAFSSGPYAYGVGVRVSTFNNTQDAVALIAGTPGTSSMTVVNNNINNTPTIDIDWYAIGPA